MSAKNRYGWCVVGTTLANQSLSMGILLAGFALFVVPWVEEFGVARSQVLICSTLILVVNSLLSPLAGKLMDSLSLRTLIVLGVICLGAGLTLVSFATSFWMILAAYATLLPISLVMCGSLSSQTLVSKWFTEGRGFALGISSLGSSLGGFVLPAIIALLIGIILPTMSHARNMSRRDLRVERASDWFRSAHVRRRQQKQVAHAH